MQVGAVHILIIILQIFPTSLGDNKLEDMDEDWLLLQNCCFLYQLIHSSAQKTKEEYFLNKIKYPTQEQTLAQLKGIKEVNS